MSHCAKIQFFLWMALLAMVPCLVSGQTKRALLVGISDYQSSEVMTGWGNINGKNDVLLLAADLKRQGFEELTVLSDAEATYAQIVGGLDELVRQAAPGDLIYFHFSGHGQPVLDLNHDEGDDDRWDESIVPIDAPSFYMEGEYEGEHHIIDDLLNEKFRSLRKKVGRKGMVYAVIDACFSGTSARGDEVEGPQRGTSTGFTFGEVVKYDAPVKRQSHYVLEHSEKLSDMVVLEACRPYQTNTEIKVGNRFYGPLSYHIHQTLEQHQLDKDTSWIDMVIRSFKKDRRTSNQNIVCESSINNGKDY